MLTFWPWGKESRGPPYHLSSRLDLIFANETLLDTRGAEGAGSDVSAGPEQRVSLHVRTHHALLQRLHVAVQRRAAGAHLAAGPLRGKQQYACESGKDCKWDGLAENKRDSQEPNKEENMLPFSLHCRFVFWNKKTPLISLRWRLLSFALFMGGYHLNCLHVIKTIVMVNSSAQKSKGMTQRLNK